MVKKEGGKETVTAASALGPRMQKQSSSFRAQAQYARAHQFVRTAGVEVVSRTVAVRSVIRSVGWE
jgi:hypothetical protein